MEQILLFAVLGLGTGALIAGLGLSLVATYRGSGTINIATGAIAMFGAYVFYGLHVGGYLLFPGLRIAGGQGLVEPVVPAVLYTLITCAVLGVVLHYLVMRPLRQQSALAKLVASVGILLIIQSYVVLTFGTQGLPAPNVLPTNAVHLLGGDVPSNRFQLLILVVVLTVVLAVAYHFTRFGLATRAAQESETEAALSGLSANRLELINTVISCVIAGGLGMFVAPLTQLDPSTIALAVVPALGAALLARFTSFVTVAGAGIGMGILASLVAYAQGQSWFPASQGVPWPGVTDLVYFVVIVIALLWRGQSLPDRGTLVEPRLPKAPPPERVMRPTLISRQHRAGRGVPAAVQPAGGAHRLHDRHDRLPVAGPADRAGRPGVAVPVRPGRRRRGDHVQARLQPRHRMALVTAARRPGRSHPGAGDRTACLAGPRRATGHPHPGRSLRAEQLLLRQPRLRGPGRGRAGTAADDLRLLDRDELPGTVPGR